MSDQGHEPRDSAAYRLGYSMGVLARVALIIFALSIAALALGGSFAPESWEVAITVGALVSGAASAVLLGAAMRNAFWFLIGMYVLLVGVGSIIQGQDPKPKAALVAVSIGTVGALVGAMIVAIGSGRRSRELERLLFSESTSVAFFVTMLGAATYALLEAWIHAPELSMWFVWSFGMVAWIVASTVFKRRYS